MDKLKRTVHTKKSLTEGMLSYGILIRNTTDFIFFRKYMADNLLEFNMCHKLHVNSMVSDKAFKDYGKVRMFSAKNGVFFPFLQYGGISLLVVVCFGCVYEVVKKLMEM